MPGLFVASDRASRAAQLRYLWMVGTDLTMMVLAAAAGAVSVGSGQHKELLAVGSASLIAASLILTIALRAQRQAAVWFNGRAVAESVKTTAWRYITGAEPFPIEAAPAAADQRLTEALAGFLSERKDLAGSLAADDTELPAITTRMRVCRALGLADRVALYLNARVDQQRSWYARKADASRRLATRLFTGVLLTQFLGLIAAILMVRSPASPLNLVGVFSALGAALIAWSQLKRYEELATAYGLAAQELTYISERGRYIKTEGELSDFVLSAENAISREHTLWRARREHY